jgi:hypothetical protein
MTIPEAVSLVLQAGSRIQPSLGRRRPFSEKKQLCPKKPVLRQWTFRNWLSRKHKNSQNWKHSKRSWRSAWRKNL